MESAIFTRMANALREQFPGITVSGEYQNAPVRFPFVSLVEADSYVYRRAHAGADREEYTAVLYVVNVYANKAGEKKSECRKILHFMDEMLYGMNFTRISMNPVPNLEDGTIYRLNARYEAVTDGTTIYRR